MKHTVFLFGCAGLAAAAGLCNPAHAASDLIADAVLRPVDDATLAQTSGRYAGGQAISGFVLTLLSRWTLPDGARLSAGGTLAVGPGPAGNAQVQVGTAAAVIGATAQPGAVGISGSSGNDSARGARNVANNVDGVSQVTQVAGDRNVGTNTAVIDFVPAGAGATPTGGPNYDGRASSSASNAAGTLKAGIAFTSTGATVSLQTPQGVAMQTLAAAGLSNPTGNVAQWLQIAGNGQQVQNLLQLHLNTQPLAPQQLRQAAALQALQSMLPLHR